MFALQTSSGVYDLSKQLLLGSTPTTPTDPPTSTLSAAATQYLSPTGAVRFGGYVAGNNINEQLVWNSEAPAGARPWDIKMYASLATTSIPPALAQAARDGHPIHFPIALSGGTSADASRGLPAPGAGPVGGKGIWTYNQITSGAMDGYIDWLSTQYKSLPDNAMIISDINIEAESVSPDTGRRESFSNPRWYDDRVSLGDTAVRNILKEYGDAYRYWRARMEANGVVNAVWVRNYAALGYVGSWHNTNVYPAMWPGADVVDILGWDPYVNTPATQSWENKLQTTVNYLRNTGAGLSKPFFRTDKPITEVPWMLPEYGCTPTSDSAAINWLNAIPEALTRYPEIRSMLFFSSEGTESTTIHTLPAVRAAFAALSGNTIFKTGA